MIRPAGLADLDALARLEQRAFEADRLSRRSFRHLLTRGHALTLVDEAGGELRGYVLLLLRRGTSLAQALRRQGVARGLVEAAEAAAVEQGCMVLRLEVRRDNVASLGLFHRLGYRDFGVYPDYYEDAMDALRLEKYLAPHAPPRLTRVPFYGQTLEFTCGPAALIMAMHALEPRLEPDRTLELRLWRESTTIFMTSGHGGCGPEGLALAAHQRGFDVEVYRNMAGPMFVDSVRSQEKKAVMALVHDDFMAQVAEAGIPLHYRSLDAQALEAEYRRGAVALVLISQYRITRERAPHWVVVTGIDAGYVYLNDPDTDLDDPHGVPELECINLPVPRGEFDRMARYGRSGQRAVVLIRAAEGAAGGGP